MWKKFLSAFEIFIHFLNSSLNSKKIKSLGENLSQFQPWNFHRMNRRTIARNNRSNYIPASSIIRPVDFANRRDESRSPSLSPCDLLLLVESQVGSCRLFRKIRRRKGKKKIKKKIKKRDRKERKKERRKELITWLRALDTGNSILFKSFSSQGFFVRRNVERKRLVKGVGATRGSRGEKAARRRLMRH